MVLGDLFEGLKDTKAARSLEYGSTSHAHAVSMKVECFVGDHLGSTSLTTDSAGAKISEIRYKPCPYRVLREGETRYSWTNDTQTTTPAYQLTRYTFTGQYSYMDDPSTSAVEGFGLMYYGARMYDPALGRFSSPDTIIPESQGTQAWDRYAYVNNDPVQYTDPSGHCTGDNWCFEENHKACDLACWRERRQAEQQKKTPGIVVDGYLEQQNCMAHINDGYWANRCGGKLGTDFTHIFITATGHEGSYLQTSYDSPTRFVIDTAGDIVMTFVPVKGYRLLWKQLAVGEISIATSMMKTRGVGGTDAWDDTLGVAISEAGDVHNGIERGSDVNLFVFTNVYEKVDVGAGGTYFAASTRFVVVVQPAGKSFYQPMYISNIYLSEFKNYWGIP